MAGGLFSRLKNWIGNETLKTTDLNAEFNHFLSRFAPAYIDDYASSTAVFQQTQNPGAVGSETLPTSLAEELKVIRYMLGQVTGGAQWYSAPANTLGGLNTLLNTLSFIPAHRITSGRVDANRQPMHLVPAGSSAGLTLKATSTNLAMVMTSAAVTFTADIAVSGLSTAPSSANTCAVNDATLAGADATKLQGESGTTITIGTIGANISALNGTVAAFKVGAEYFLAEVDTSLNVLKNATRGFFFSSADAAFPRVAISDTNTITLMKLGYVFATYNASTAAVDVTYNLPVIANTQPSSPSVGDWWYDLVNGVWKRYSGAAYVTQSAVPVGLVVMDSSNCVAARSFDAFKPVAATNTLNLIYVTSNTVRTKETGQRINVYGSNFTFDMNNVTWSMATDLDSGETDANSKTYYFYLTDQGAKKITTVAPHNRIYDLRGWYHSHKPWRCVGRITNDGSADFTASTMVSGEYSELFVQKRNLVSLGQVISSSCGSFTRTSSTPADITNLTATVTTTGRPVRVELIPDGSANYGVFKFPGAATRVQLLLLRDGVEIARTNVFGTVSSNIEVPAVWSLLDPVAAGTYVYKLQLASTNNAATVEIAYVKLAVFEL